MFCDLASYSHIFWEPFCHIQLLPKKKVLIAIYLFMVLSLVLFIGYFVHMYMCLSS